MLFCDVKGLVNVMSIVPHGKINISYICSKVGRETYFLQTFVLLRNVNSVVKYKFLRYDRIRIM